MTDKTPEQIAADEAAAKGEEQQKPPETRTDADREGTRTEIVAEGEREREIEAARLSGRKPEEGGEGDKKEEDKKGEEGDPPLFSEDQLAEIAANPDIQKRVLAHDDTRGGINALITELEEEASRTAQTTEEREKTQQTLAEAVKSNNDGEPQALATWAMTYLRQQQQEVGVQNAAAPVVRAKMNAFIEDEYGEELKRLSKEDTAKLKAFDPNDSSQDDAFYDTLLTVVRSMRSGGKTSASDDQDTALRQAAASSAHSASARKDITPALPRASANNDEGEAQGTNIGALMRQAMAEDLAKTQV